MTRTKTKPISPASLRYKAMLFKALASPARVAIVEALARENRTVNQLVEMLEGLDCACSVERTNISKHLAVLREAGIVSCEEDGVSRIYSLAMPCVADMLACSEGQTRDGTAACACGKTKK